MKEENEILFDNLKENIEFLIIPCSIELVWLVYFIEIKEKKIRKYCTFPKSKKAKDEEFIKRVQKLFKSDFDCKPFDVGEQSQLYYSGFYALNFIKTVLIKNYGSHILSSYKEERMRYNDFMNEINEIICFN